MTRTDLLLVTLVTCLAAQAWAGPDGEVRKAPPSKSSGESRTTQARPAARKPAPAKEPARQVAATQPAEPRLSKATRPAASQSAAVGPVIQNPRVTCDRWPSNYDAASWMADVWRIENAKTGEEKTLALYKWVRLQQHWGEQCHDGTRGKTAVECDAIKKLSIYPYGECSDFGVTAAALGHAGGLKAMEAHVPGHTQLEVQYKDGDGVERWHRLDPFWGVVIYDKTGKRIASWEEIQRDPLIALEPSKTVEPWGDKVTDRKRFAEKAACEPSRRVRPSRYTMDKPLYAGETYILSWDRLIDLPFCNANPEARDKMTLWGFPRYQYAGGDPAKLAFGHEALRPYIEKVDDQLQVHEAHGTLFFKPLLNERFADSVYIPAVNVRVTSAGRALRPAKAGMPAELVYLVQTPYVIANGAIAGNFRTSKGDSVRVSLARADWRESDYTLDQVIPVKPDWNVVWESSGDGQQVMRLREASLQLRGEYKFLVKVEMLASTDPSTISMDVLGFVARFQEGVMALPRLMPGKNTIHVSAGQVKPGYKLHVTCIWDDAKAKERETTQLIEHLPFSFEIDAAGETPADVRSRALILQAVYGTEQAAGQPSSREPRR